MTKEYMKKEGLFQTLVEGRYSEEERKTTPLDTIKFWLMLTYSYLIH